MAVMNLRAGVVPPNLENAECNHCQARYIKQKNLDIRIQAVYPEYYELCNKCQQAYVRKIDREKADVIKRCQVCGYPHLEDGYQCGKCALSYGKCNNCAAPYNKHEGKEVNRFRLMGERGRFKHILYDGLCDECIKDDLVRCECGNYYNTDEPCCSVCMKRPRAACSICEKEERADHLLKLTNPLGQLEHVCHECYRGIGAGDCRQCGKASYPLGTKYHQHHDHGKRCPKCADGIPIMSYNYHRPPKFFGEGPLYFGIENEYDFHEGDYVQYTDIMRQWVLERYNMYHLTHDGSLLWGAEIVSQPCSYEEWMGKDAILPPIPNVLDNRSKKTGEIGTAACHIHMSKAAFGKFHMYKFITFLNDNFERLLPVFGRGIGDYCRDIEGDLCSFVRNNKRGLRRGDDKYKWISLAPAHTIEVRVFRAAQNDDDIRSYLQILMAAYEFTKKRGSKQLHWDDYLELLRHNYPLAWEKLHAETITNEPPVCPAYSRSRGAKQLNPRIPERARKKMQREAIPIPNFNPKQWVVNNVV